MPTWRIMRKLLQTDEFMGTAEAAKLLKMTQQGIRNLIAEGLLPAKRLGRDYMLMRADVLKVPKRKRGPKPKGKK
jgi:excisionase family DNA binding protein